jgi:hypothetical protein
MRIRIFIRFRIQNTAPDHFDASQTPKPSLSYRYQSGRHFRQYLVGEAGSTEGRQLINLKMTGHLEIVS